MALTPCSYDSMIILEMFSGLLCKSSWYNLALWPKKGSPRKGALPNIALGISLSLYFKLLLKI